jgi:hypothetical protein
LAPGNDRSPERVDHEEPALAAGFKAEEAALVGVEHVDHAHRALFEPLGAVGPEVDRDAVAEPAGPAMPMPSCWRIGLRFAVGGDHVAGADRADLATVDVAHMRSDSGLVLREVDQLASVMQLRPELGRRGGGAAARGSAG